MKALKRGILLCILLATSSTSVGAHSFDSLLQELVGLGEGSDDSSPSAEGADSTGSQKVEGESPGQEVLPLSLPTGDPAGTAHQPGSSETLAPQEATVEAQKQDLPPLPTGPLLPSSLDIMSTSVEEEVVVPQNIRTNGVVIQGLDKTTARVFITKALVGQEIEFGTLKIKVQRCEKTPPELHQDSIAFVTITETKPNCPARSVFSGWMFSASPSLSAFDHPLYDVWIKECKNIKNTKRK